MANKSSEENQILINKNVFPLSQDIWESMWFRIKSLHPDADKIIESIRDDDVDAPKVC